MTDTIWSDKMVMAYLEEAAAIHRRLPPVKVQGYFNLWPEALKDDWERLYDAINAKTRLGAPMPHEVTYHETIMAWLRWLDPYSQKLVWMRANRIPWKIIEDKLSKGKTALWQDYKAAIALITGKLSAREPPRV